MLSNTSTRLQQSISENESTLSVKKNKTWVSLEIRETKSQIFCFCFTNFSVLYQVLDLLTPSVWVMVLELVVQVVYVLATYIRNIILLLRFLMVQAYSIY